MQTSRELDCLLMMDEFYSHYIYTDDEENGKTVSSAEYVEDVNVDPLIIIDGLTKNWRCPGWRSMRVEQPTCLELCSDRFCSFNGGLCTRTLRFC